MKPIAAKKYLSKSEINMIFSNIEEIEDVTAKTLKSFEAARTPAGLNPNIGVLFTQNVSKLSLKIRRHLCIFIIRTAQILCQQQNI